MYVAGVQYNACVSCYKKAHLFCILSDYASKELQALALASASLRDPLQNALSGAKQLFMRLSDTTDPALLKTFGQINRSLHQLLRSIGNMSDAATYSQHCPEQFQYLDAKALFAEIAEKIQAKIPADICSIKYTGPTKQIYTMLHPELLERAICNLISNAIKFSPNQSTVNLKVSEKGDRMHIAVENTCDIAAEHVSQYFDRFLREPGLEENRFGIGLGLSIVQSVASAHHGTLLVSRKKQNIVSFVMAIAILEKRSHTLRSPSGISMDYSGGFDSTLVELSDILPNEMYEHL